MKTNKTISIDIETWAQAKGAYENLSQRIEELLQTDLATQKPEDLKQLKAQAEGATLKATALQAELTKAKKKIEEMNARPFKYDPDNHITKEEWTE